MTKLYLIHGWGGSINSEPWFNWLDKKFEKRNLEMNLEMIIPQMPDTNSPKIDEWIKKLNEIVDLDSQTYFVAHSIGCQAVIRFLSQVKEDMDISGIVFVAPWIKLDEKSIEEEGPESVAVVESWISRPIDYENTRKFCSRVLSIFSDNDPYVPLSNVDIFRKELNSEIIIKSGEEHFNETKEINEIVEFIDNDN